MVASHFTFSLASPGDEQAANWLPSPEGPFYMVMRLYNPEPRAYEGNWSPALVWPEASTPQADVAKPAGVLATEEVKPPTLNEEPKPEMERPTIWGEPTEVQVAIYVIDVDEVDSADQSFAASVYFQAQWKNPLLRHKGSGPLESGIKRCLESATDDHRSTDGLEVLSRSGGNSTRRHHHPASKGMGAFFPAAGLKKLPN